MLSLRHQSSVNISETTMSKVKSILLLSLFLILGGCGGDNFNGEASVEFELGEKIHVEEFEVTKAIAVKRAEPHPTYHDAEIILANYKVLLSKQGTIITPTKPGQVAFVIDLDDPKVGEHTEDFMVWVYKDNANYCLSGEKWGCDLTTFSGMLNIDEISDEKIVGSIDYVHKKGPFLRASFNVPVKVAK